MSGFYSMQRDYTATLLTNKYTPIQRRNIMVVLNALCVRVRYNGNYSKEFEIGQCLVGRKELADEWGLSEDDVRYALKALTTLPVVSLKPTQKGTIVTFQDQRYFSKVLPELSQHSPRVPPLTDSTKTETKKKKTVSASPPRPACDLFTFLNKLGKEFPREFLELEYTKAVEWWKESKGREPTMRALTNWVTGPFGKQSYVRWSNETGYERRKVFEELDKKLAEMGTTAYDPRTI